jgi:four helix bundle protein
LKGASHAASTPLTRGLATRRRSVVDLHRLAGEKFPQSERFELSSQLRRAAYSVPANIVEKFARRHRRQRLHFF